MPIWTASRLRPSALPLPGSLWCVQELAVVHMQSARTIQAAFRGHQAREKRQRDEEQEEQEMDDMATRVQALYRSVRPRPPTPSPGE